MLKKTLSLTVIVCFFLTSLTPYPQAHADTILNLPAPGTMINLSPAYQPVIIKGLTVHKDNPFLFDFIVDVGQDKMSGEPLKKEGEKLIKYFLASLAIPDQDLWVNLSPYEKNRMIPEALGQTDMGRDLLEQDYILKQITASLIYPEKQLGKTFWDRVYARAQQELGTTKIPVNTFNKVWIMADKASIFEHNQTAFVVDCHLKVMLEEDYLALSHHSGRSVILSEAKDLNKLKDSSATPQNDSHFIASQIVRQIILPELEKEVNTGKNFANLRQIFNSIILSSWYKKNLKEALLNQVYANKSKVKGINLNDPTIKQQIYDQYLKAYKKGVFNYIKEDVNAANGEMMPRKYFSGGLAIAGTPAANPTDITDTAVGSKDLAQGSWYGEVDFATLASTQGTLTPTLPTNAAMVVDPSKYDLMGTFSDPLKTTYRLSWKGTKEHAADLIVQRFRSDYRTHIALTSYWSGGKNYSATLAGWQHLSLEATIFNINKAYGNAAMVVTIKDVTKGVKSLIAELTGTRSELINENELLRDDLRMDSLDVVGLIMRLEEKFDIEIPNEDEIRIFRAPNATVNQVIEYVIEKTNATANAAMTALTLNDFNPNMRQDVEGFVKMFGWNMANVRVIDKGFDKQRLIDEEVEAGKTTGRFIKLNDGNYYAQSHPNDVQRAPPRTFVSTLNPNDKGLNNNWKPEDTFRNELIQMMQRDAKPTDTVYVLPYLRGPKGSPFSKVGVEITTDRQVALQIMTLYKVGWDAIDHLKDSTYFTKGVNVPGDLDVLWGIIGKGGADGRHFAAFLNRREFLSRGSAYGGNAILPKKFELRQGMWDSVEAILNEGKVLLSEHMFILQITEKKTGRKFHILGAFPSSSGKTNMGMIEIPDELKDEYSAEMISDDLSDIFQATDPNVYSPEELGHLFVQNPEDGVFGVIYGTGWGTNSALMKSLKPNSDIIYTNVAINRKLGEVWWEKKTDDYPPYDEYAPFWQDWKGSKIIDRVVTDADAQKKYQKNLTDLTPEEVWQLKAEKGVWAHANSRASVPMESIVNLSPDFYNPKGVKIDAILWGGRTDNHPLLYIPYDSIEGITDGTSAVAKSTAASEGAVGKLDADPNAQLPFFGPPEGRYFAAWLKVDEIVGDKMPVFAHINQIQANWPGYGKNAHLLKLLIDYIKGDKSNFQKTALGYVPAEGAFNLEHFTNPKTGSTLTSDELKQLRGYDPYYMLYEEMPRREASYDKIDAQSPNNKVPQELRDKNAEIKRRLESEVAAIELGQIEQALANPKVTQGADGRSSVVAFESDRPILDKTLRAVVLARRNAGAIDQIGIDSKRNENKYQMVLKVTSNYKEKFTDNLNNIRLALPSIREELSKQAVSNAAMASAPATIDEFLQKNYPDVFGVHDVNGQRVDVLQAIGAAEDRFGRQRDFLLAHRADILRWQLAGTVKPVYNDPVLGWDNPNKTYTHPLYGTIKTVAQIRQGMIDNAFGIKSDDAWRLNNDVRPSQRYFKRGLELTGPRSKRNMLVNALNAAENGEVVSDMGDFEDATPDEYNGSQFEQVRSLGELYKGEWKFGRTWVDPKTKRTYQVRVRPEDQAVEIPRIPGLALRDRRIFYKGKQVSETFSKFLIHFINNFDDIINNTQEGFGLYVPKIESAEEADLVARLFMFGEDLGHLEHGTIKIKMLNERHGFARNQEVIEWILSPWLLGTNVGRWDYTNSLFELHLGGSQGHAFMDPSKFGFLTKQLHAYNRRNAILDLLVAIDENGEMTLGAPIGGMFAGMKTNDEKWNAQALSQIFFDKLRERLTGLFILNGKIYDTYHQSWIAAPETDYVRSGARPLQAKYEDLEKLVQELSVDQRNGLRQLGLIDENGKVTPYELTKERLNNLWSESDYNEMFSIPEGPITIEELEYALYMASEYGFQILNGNNAAKIPDYRTNGAIMNDFATYEIFWHFIKHVLDNGVALTKDGQTLRGTKYAAGTEVNWDVIRTLLDERRKTVKEYFEQHPENPMGFDREQANVIMDVLEKQFQNKQFIPYGARVLIVLRGVKDENIRKAIINAIDTPREAVVAQINKAREQKKSQRLLKLALGERDFIYDFFPEYEKAILGALAHAPIDVVTKDLQEAFAKRDVSTEVGLIQQLRRQKRININQLDSVDQLVAANSNFRFVNNTPFLREKLAANAAMATKNGNNGKKIKRPWDSRRDVSPINPTRSRADSAQTAVNGGIDLNTSNGMQWKVGKDGNGVEMNVDPAMIARVRHDGIDSLTPVVYRMTPIASIWPIVGLEAPKREEFLAKV